MEDINMDDVYRLTRSAVARSKQWVYREFDDTLQEALMYVVNNLKYYNKEKGRLATFIYVNVKRSLINQVKYVNAKKRQLNNSLFSLDVMVNEDYTLSDQVLSETNTEEEVMWENLISRLNTMERDIVENIVNNEPLNLLQEKYKTDWRGIQTHRNRLLEKLKDEFLINL